MTGSLLALSWTVSTGPGTGFFPSTSLRTGVAPLLRMTDRSQLIGDVSLLP